MADAQARVQAVLDELVGRDEERGLQVAAYVDGELVIDAWAGLSDAATGRPVDGATLFTVFSCTKGVTATVVHLLAERGQLDYDTPIAEYWPDFAANGKAGITVRHALTHRAGLPQMPDGVTPETMCDWGWMCRRIADHAPLWEPGTATGYHALTYGWLLGEVARRVDGRPIAAIVQDEICKPLGIADLYLGIPDAVESRVATLESDPHAAPAPQSPPDALIRRAVPPSLGLLEQPFNRADVRRASIPGGGGIMTARALARHYAALAGGDSRQLLPPERLRLATTLQTDETDVVLGVPARKALGYWLGGSLSPMGDRPSAFGHGGYGGSIGFADPEHRFAFALAKTRMVTSLPGEGTASRVARAARAALGIPEAG